MTYVNQMSWLNPDNIDENYNRLNYEAIENIAPEKLPRDRLVPTAKMRSAGLVLPKITDLEAFKKTYKPFHSLLAIHGWLSPEGQLYPCGFKQHDILIQLLGFQYELHAENEGWCKLANMQWLVQPKYLAKRLTRQQLATIKEWYKLNEFPMSHYNRYVLIDEF